jgi:hypothetical protein
MVRVVRIFYNSIYILSLFNDHFKAGKNFLTLSILIAKNVVYILGVLAKSRVTALMKLLTRNYWHNIIHTQNALGYNDSLF